CSSRRTSSLPGLCMRCEGNSEDPSTKKAKDSAGGRPAWTRRNDWISRSSAVKSTNLRDPASYFCSSRMPPTSRTSRCGSLSWPTKPSASRGGTSGSSESFCRSSAAGKSAARIAGRIAGDLETTATYPGRKAIWPFAPSSLTRWYSSSVSCGLRPPRLATAGKAGSLRRLLRGGLLGALEPRRLSLQVAQIEEPCALDAPAGDHLDLVDARREYREDALHADPVGDLPHREGRAQMAPLPADDDAFEDLDALLVALADLGVDPHRVAHAQGGQLRPRLRLHVPLLDQLYRLHAHLARSFE